jgi:hypothetical protein
MTSEAKLCDFDYQETPRTVRRWGECHYRCRHCGAWRPQPWSRQCTAQDQPPPPGAPYIIDQANGKTVWGCRACDWLQERSDDEQPDHRCGQKECKHKGVAKGTVKVECCSGQEKLLTACECAIHARCLPGFVRHEAAIAKWNERKPESDIYHLCCICTEREDN